MAQNNVNVQHIRTLLSTLKSEIATVRELHEKMLSSLGEEHPQTIAARQELDELLLELKNFVYWLDETDF